MVECSSTSFNPLERPAIGSREPEEPNTSASTQHTLCRTHPIISREPKNQQVKLMLWPGEVQAPQPGKFQMPPLWQ